MTAISRSRIALIGFMGSGKSTAAALLAPQLGLRAYDSDSVIESEQGMSITGIFASRGEAYFRLLEEETISRLCCQDRFVLSTGGGSILSEKTRAVLKSRCTVFYLNTSREQILKNLRNSSHRPLLEKADKAQALDALLAQRSHYYAECCHFTVNATGRGIAECVAEIIRLVKSEAI